RAMVCVDDGSLWISAHAAGAEHRKGELLFLDRQAPFLLRPSGVQNGESLLIHEIRELQIVGGVLVGHATCREAPSVLHVHIKENGIGCHGEGCAVRKDFDGPREIACDGVLKLFSPAGSIGWKPLAVSKIDWGHIKAGVDTPSAAKADFLRVEF